MFALCGLAVFARWWPTVPHGFFRYDDFDLIAVARDYAWTEAFWMPHGDHFLPLTRAIAEAAYALFGVTAWPYNLGVLLCMWALVALGCLLLGELKVSRPAQLLFVALAVLWSPWAEITSGYYILSSYTLIAALGLGAVWLYLGWRIQGGSLRVAVALLCVLTAPLIDISGWYVPPALGIFLWADFVVREKPRAWRTWFVAHRTFLLGLAIAVATSLACTLYAYGVVNRGSFLSMGAGGSRTLAHLAADFVYLFNAGLLVTLAAPFIYARLPLALLTGACVVAFALWAALMFRNPARIAPTALRARQPGARPRRHLPHGESRAPLRRHDLGPVGGKTRGARLRLALPAAGRGVAHAVVGHHRSAPTAPR